MIDSLTRALFDESRYLLYLKGISNTITITIFALILGVLIGLIISIGRFSTKNNPKLKIIYFFCNFYITIIRGTPVLVQLLIIYNIVFVSGNISPIISAIVCFGINSGAYVSEIFRAGIESIDKGQMEAARSLGLSYFVSMKNIIIPQATKNILPTLGNEFIALLKETSIVGTISIFDITRAASSIYTTTYDFVGPLLIISLIYLILVVGLGKLFSLMEKKLVVKND